MLLTSRNFRTTCAPKVYPAPRGERKLITLCIWIRPDEIGHRAFVWNLAESVYDFDLINGVNGGRKTAMYTEDLVINHDTQCQEVEHVGEVVPDVGVAVLACTLGIKPIRLGDSARLVITADEVDSRGIS